MQAAPASKISDAGALAEIASHHSAPKPGAASLREKISVHKLNFYYEDGNRALKDISVPIYENHVTGFIGPSGFGKSTLLRVLNRVYDLYDGQRADGEVFLDDENILTRKADLLLPACTAWECEAVRPFFPGTAKTMRWSQFRNAVIAPLYDSRPDFELLFDLAKRLVLGDHFFNGDVEAAWDHHLEPSGLTVQKLRENPIGIGGEVVTRYQKYAAPNPDSGRPRGFPTPSGRIELYSKSFAKAGYAPLPAYVEPIESPVREPNSDYPLVLTSFRSINYCDQQHRNIPRLRRGVPDPVVKINPGTAAKLNIADGAWAIVETRTARIKLKASYNHSLNPGVVATTYGWWQACRELGLPATIRSGQTGPT